jgi:glycosyltransferase involved in cell wall biosynthesis
MRERGDREGAAVRILILDLSTRFGGASARALGLLEGFEGAAELGCLASSPIESMAREGGCSVHRLGTTKYDPRIPFRIRALVRTGRFDVIDSQNPQSKLHATIASLGMPVALVSTLNSWYPLEHEGRLKGRVYGGIERLTSARTDVFVAVAPEIRSALLEVGIAGSRIQVVPNAVDTSDHSSEHAAARHTILERYGFADDARIVCAVGRLVEAKALDVLLDAIAAIVPEYPTISLLLVGSGHLGADLEHQVSRLGIGGRVRFAGLLDRTATAAAILGCDVFVMASRTEGLPIALLEAAAAARPIVATTVGGIPGALESPGEALLVSPEDALALGRAIGRLFDDSAGASEMGARARARVAREFGRERQIGLMRTVYDQARSRRTLTSGKGGRA